MLVTTKNLPLLAPLYEGVEDTMVRSVLDGSMGWAFVDDIDGPGCAVLMVADFLFPAGDADSPVACKLLRAAAGPLQGHVCAFAVPPDEGWKRELYRAFGESSETFLRYATHKDTAFDRQRLQGFVDALPKGYTLKAIDKGLYYRCLQDPLVYDFCGNFLSEEDFMSRGLGYCVFSGDRIVGGASSYTVYKGGIEIETDTHPEHRRRGIAAAASARLILDCLDNGLYPSWDAANKGSLALAQKLGYTAAEPYKTVAINPNWRVTA